MRCWIITVIIKKNSRFKIKFPSLKTKEDYVLWLKISKTGYKFYGLNLPLVSWRKTKNSLSSSLTQKLLDGFRVYNIYEGKSIMNSLINLLYLSINYIKKNLDYEKNSVNNWYYRSRWILFS